MIETPTREILWNIQHPANVVLMYSLFVFSLLIAGFGLFRRVELWRAGPSYSDKTDSLTRLVKMIQWGILQKGVIRERSAAIAHTLVYIGFLTLLFTTTMVFIDHDLGIKIYHGDFYLIVTLLSDILGLGVLIGCGIAAHRRYILKADMVHNRLADGLILSLLSILIVQGFILEGLRIHATNDPWALYSPVGLLVAKFFWSLSPSATSSLHFVFWWVHTITVFSVFAIAPYTKFFHIVASVFNLYWKDWAKPKGRIRSPGDIASLIEKGEEFQIGLGTIKDYNFKQRLDLDACTSCGRCQDACPAY
ncbi:MAG: respiratory nitrate reductase subunit gamma, partial [Bdellovibrionales bacterium]|nr:respiratory nitrate reductase subunit gamma [Bdellovibrionales bacterium]